MYHVTAYIVHAFDISIHYIYVLHIKLYTCMAYLLYLVCQQIPRLHTNYNPDFCCDRVCHILVIVIRVILHVELRFYALLESVNTKGMWL